jgi:CheY-like chemotaxis protein
MTLDRSTITILVVEDEVLSRLDLVETLRSASYEVLEASNAHEALGYLRQRVDVVITDIHLGGGLTGWDVAEEFRAARSGIPIIYTSGNAVDGAPVGSLRQALIALGDIKQGLALLQQSNPLCQPPNAARLRAILSCRFDGHTGPWLLHSRRRSMSHLYLVADQS